MSEVQTQGYHGMTRVVVRRSGGVWHLVSACTHGHAAESLCGRPVREGGVRFGLGGACKDCRLILSTGAAPHPTGPDHALAAFDLTNPTPPSDPLHSIAEGLAVLDGIDPSDAAPVGAMRVSVTNTQAHADPRCPHYDPLHERDADVSMDTNGALVVSPDLHCPGAGFPEKAGQVAYHAVMIRDGREALLRLRDYRGSSLYRQVRESEDSADPTWSYMRAPLEADGLPDWLAEEHEKTRAHYLRLLDASRGWERSERAQWETTRQVGYMAAANGALGNVEAFSIFSLSVGPARVEMGHPWIALGMGAIAEAGVEALLANSPMAEVMDGVLVEDIMDALRTFDRTVTWLALERMGGERGYVVAFAEGAPEWAVVWPHRVLDEGRVEVWVPAPVKEVIEDHVPGVMEVCSDVVSVGLAKALLGVE